MKVNQREIVEVSFKFLNGKDLIHPALVISPEELQEHEPGMFYAILISSKNIHPNLTLEILPEDILGPNLDKKSYVVTHFLAYFTTDQVVSKRGQFVKVKKFNTIVDTIINNIFGDPIPEC